MNTSLIRCPNCGSVDVAFMSADKYRCSHCTAYFQFTRPDTQRFDVVTHNCSSCGKPIDTGKGYKCAKCNRSDFCDTCVDKVPNRGYLCKSCTKEIGEDCIICGKFAWRTCGSCKQRHDRDEIPKDEVFRTCDDCFDSLFTDLIDLKLPSGRNVTAGLKVSFNCPKCGDICRDCAVEKKSWIASGHYCKNCGSKVNLNRLWAADGSI